MNIKTMRAAESLAFLMDARSLAPETVEKAYRAAILLGTMTDDGSPEFGALADMIRAVARHHPSYKKEVS